MNLSLGGIVKGITTGLETLVETGNPAIAAGAGAVACLAGNGGSGNTQSQSVPTFDPLLDEMSASLNPGSSQNVYSYAQLAGLNSNGQPTQSDPYGGVTEADLVE